MSQALDDYIAKIEAARAAGHAVDEMIVRLHQVMEPLFTGWRRTYLRLPGAAMPMGMAHLRRAIDAMQEVPDLPSLHTAMVKHFEARQAAEQAHARLTEAEKNQLIQPQWDRV